MARRERFTADRPLTCVIGVHLGRDVSLRGNGPGLRFRTIPVETWWALPSVGFRASCDSWRGDFFLPFPIAAVVGGDDDDR